MIRGVYLFLESNEFVLQKSRGSRYSFIVVDVFSKMDWTFSLKNKIAHTVHQTFAQCIGRTNSKLIEADGGKEFVN